MCLALSTALTRHRSGAELIWRLPAETINEFARLYARSKPVNLNTAWSLGVSFFGENGIRAAMYLQALTGNTMSPAAQLQQNIM